MRTLLPTLLLASAMGAALGATATPLPTEVAAALARAHIPADAVAVVLQEAQAPNTAARLSHRAQTPMNPASVMKLVTTFAALELLGPAYVWQTPVYVDGAVHDGTLHGNVTIVGQGDPKLVLERLWLLLHRLQGLGIRSIAGDIVLDRTAFDLADADPSQFDGEPLRPYNAAPDALLINYKAVLMGFTPNPGGQTAQVQFDPPLAGVQTQDTVPLGAGDCGDYRSTLKADFSDASRIRFTGSYPASCGEKLWPVAYADPGSYAPRAVQGLWLAMGGHLSGSVHYGSLPAALALGRPTFEHSSAPLAELIRDINKYSNNVMAQQVFLTLGRIVPTERVGTNSDTVAEQTGEGRAVAPGSGSLAAARAVLQRWWRARIDSDDVPLLDNGSGLSRQERISAQGLARMLQVAYQSPSMSELMSSLPIAGVDGTLKRLQTGSQGSAHLKTGTLSNVLARAGYVDGRSGKRYVLVAFINHANANTEAARAAMGVLVDWAVRDN